jgi:hypothetical protein
VPWLLHAGGLQGEDRRSPPSAETLAPRTQSVSIGQKILASPSISCRSCRIPASKPWSMHTPCRVRGAMGWRFPLIIGSCRHPLFPPIRCCIQGRFPSIPRQASCPLRAGTSLVLTRGAQSLCPGRQIPSPQRRPLLHHVSYDPCMPREEEQP